MSQSNNRPSESAISLRALLSEMGDPFDSHRIFEEIRYFFDVRDGYDPRQLLGKRYKAPSMLPNDQATRSLVRNLLVLRAMLPPKAVIKVLQDPSHVHSCISEAVQVAKVKILGAQFVLKNQETLLARVDEGTWEQDLFAGAFAPAKESALHEKATQEPPGAEIGALLNLRLLEELDNSPLVMNDSPE